MCVCITDYASRKCDSRGSQSKLQRADTPGFCKDGLNLVSCYLKDVCWLCILF